MFNPTSEDVMINKNKKTDILMLTLTLYGSSFGIFNTRVPFKCCEKSANIKMFDCDHYFYMCLKWKVDKK